MFCDMLIHPVDFVMHCQVVASRFTLPKDVDMPKKKKTCNMWLSFKCSNCVAMFRNANMPRFLWMKRQKRKKNSEFWIKNCDNARVFIPTFNKIKCIQPQSQSNMAATLKISTSSFVFLITSQTVFLYTLNIGNTPKKDLEREIEYF